MAQKPTLPKGIAQAAADEGIEDYVDPAPRPRAPRAPVPLDDDPILNIDDSQVAATGVIPTIEQMGEAIRDSAPADVDPIARLARTLEAMQRGGAQATQLPETVMERLVGAIEKLAQGQQAGMLAGAEALRRSQDPSNPVSPGVSDYNPRGERDFPRPRLKCQMFLPWEAEWESLTREEIELLNILEPGEFLISRNDESKCLITINATRSSTGRMDRLLLNAETALNNDHHWMMPPLRNTLRQILNQRPDTKRLASEVRTKEEETALVAKHGPDFEKAMGKAS